MKKKLISFLDMTSISANNSQTKRKEIYKYEAPWMVYAMNWSIRPDKRFRLALGSFVEEYNNKVKLNQINKKKTIKEFIFLGTNYFT